VAVEGLLFLVSSLRAGRAGYNPANRETRDAAGATILSYGDSIGHSYGVDWKDGYPQVLARLLNSTVRVSRGYSPSGYAEALRGDLERSSPKTVLVEIELSNDVSDEALLTWEGSDADGLPVRLAGGRYQITWDGTPGLLTAASGSHLYPRTRGYTFSLRGLGALLSRLRPNPVFADDADTYYYNLSFDRYWLTRDKLEGGFEQMFRALDAMNRFCQKRGIRFVLMILPSRHWFGSDDRFHAGAERLVARAEAKAQSLGISFVSPAHELAAAGGARLFLDFCHPTAEGHRVLAETLARALAQ
jgi:lysophospholipase L1-like esterase